MKDLSTIISETSKDRLSGSLALLHNFKSNLHSWASTSEDVRSLPVDLFSHYVVQLQEEMKDFAVLSHFINYITEQLSKNNDLLDLPQIIQRYNHKWEDICEKMAKNLRSVLNFKDKTVLLHSNSGSVSELFKLLSYENTDVNVIQTESRPKNEGIIQAEQIGNLGFPVTLIADTAIQHFIAKIDYILLGADSIFQDYFVNKIGSYSIALMARKFQIPIYVISDSRKLWKNMPSSFTRKWDGPKNYPTEELYDGNHPNIEVVNIYFESIPNQYIESIITEEQIYQPEELWEI